MGAQTLLSWYSVFNGVCSSTGKPQRFPLPREKLVLPFLRNDIFHDFFLFFFYLCSITNDPLHLVELISVVYHYIIYEIYFLHEIYLTLVKRWSY